MAPLTFCIGFLYALFSLLPTTAANECQPATWTKTHNVARGAATLMVDRDILQQRDPYVVRAVAAPQPGDLVCRHWTTIDQVVNYYTCTELAETYSITLDHFFFLNPTVRRDCSNITPGGEYCVAGYTEPLRSLDGFCGPKYRNATCSGSTFGGCCNAVTSKCGNSTEDCAPGTCYEGICPGHKYYTTDGTCGARNDYRECAGKWGDCCDLNGKCGNGTTFCGSSVCQSGNCAWKNTNGTAPTALPTSTVTSSTKSSTSSSSTSSPTPSGVCIAGTGGWDTWQICEFTCQYGYCPPDLCQCVRYGPQKPLPPPIGVPKNGAIPAWDGLCNFACLYSVNSCSASQCPGNGPTCVQGGGVWFSDPICKFTCQYGYCPPPLCTCTLKGSQKPPPPATGTPQKSWDPAYDAVCAWACVHGYCPTDVCVEF